MEFIERIKRLPIQDVDPSGLDAEQRLLLDAALIIDAPNHHMRIVGEGSERLVFGD